MTGSERARQRRHDRRLALFISRHALNLAYCAECPCDSSGSITREAVACAGYTLFEIERALRVLQRDGVLDMCEKGSGRGHVGLLRWPVMDFRGCRTRREAEERLADQRSLARRGG